MLTLTNTAAEAWGLAESEPILGAESPIDDCAPQDEHIDPRVVAMSCRILRHRERRFGRHGPPRLDPRYAAGLQLGDDLVGDFLIQAPSVSPRARALDRHPGHPPGGRRDPPSRTSTGHGRPANLSL